MVKPLTSFLPRQAPLYALSGIFISIILFFTNASAADIILAPAGAGTWSLSANDLNGVSALDINLRYDSGKFPGAVVEQGTLLQGGISVVNDQIPGSLRAASVTTGQFVSSGTILTMRSGAPGAELIPLSFTVKGTDKNGQAMPITVRNMSRTETVTTNPASLPATNPNEVASTVVSRTTGGGSVSLPSPLPEMPIPQPHEQEETPAPEPVQMAVPAPPPPKGPPLPEKEFHSQGSIIAAIEKLGTAATVGAVRAIFTSPAQDARVRQTPAVVLADGRSMVSLFLSKKTSRNKPSIGVQGCRHISTEDKGEEGWQIDLLTQEGSWPAKILLLGDKELVEFPIVVIPKIATIPPGLKDSDAIPALDLNRDGHHTALDDYLLIGNLLSANPPD